MNRRLALVLVMVVIATAALVQGVLFLVARDSLTQVSFAAVSAVSVLAATLVGLLATPLLTKPFRQLAVAADDLRRGRYDLQLPHSKVTEVEQIGAALAGAAQGFESRLREQTVFLEQASHVIRTPLTGIRLELEDLLHRSDSDEVRESVGFCVRQVEKLDRDADTVLGWAREWTAAGQPWSRLEIVARQITDSWAEAMEPYDSDFRSFLQGDIDVQVIPGLVEQLLDQALAVLLDRGDGHVRLSFNGSQRSVQIDVVAGGPDEPEDPRIQQVRLFAETVGGTVAGELFSRSGLRIRLPGR